MGEEALNAARRLAVGLEPAEAADRIGAAWDAQTGAFELPFLGTDARVTYPACEVTISERPSPPHIAALLVYHIALSEGTLPTGEWISFAALPDASFYVTAFRGYTGARIARCFGACAEELDAAVSGLGGEPLSGPADRSWRVPALPKVPIAVLWWDADDEFDARAELLFDSTAEDHLTTDGCAVLGSWMTGMLVRGREG